MGKIKKQKTEKPQERKQNENNLDQNSLDSDPKLWICFDEDSDTSNDSNKENNSTNQMIPDLIACDELKNFNFLSDLSVSSKNNVKEPLDALSVNNENKLNKRDILAKYNENKPKTWVKFESTPKRVSNENNVWKFVEQKPKKSQKKIRKSPKKTPISKNSVDEIAKQIAPKRKQIILQKPSPVQKKKHPLKPVSANRQKRIIKQKYEANKEEKSFNP